MLGAGCRAWKGVDEEDWDAASQVGHNLRDERLGGVGDYGSMH